MSVRQPQVAGYFYPDNKKELDKMIDDFLNKAKKLKLGKVRAIIVPHAGYVYSGQVAAHGYKQIDETYKKVFIIATNHSQYAIFSGASVPKFDYYETPLGKVKVSPAVKDLLKHDLFTSDEYAHLTHVEEVQLPFLQKILKDFEIIPIVLSNLVEEECKQLAEIIEKYLDDALVVISSDLSHYHPYEQAVKLDKNCISAIEKQDVEKTKTSEACGLDAILTLLYIAKTKKWKSKIIEYKNSGDVTGDKSGVVGYASIAFYD
jgi:AmmeMemoRadiSam system protein B